MTIKRRQWHLMPLKFQSTLIRVEGAVLGGRDSTQAGPDTTGYVAGMRITAREVDYNARKGTSTRRLYFPEWTAKWEMQREGDGLYGARHRFINVSYLATDESIVLRDLTLAKMSAELS